MLNLLEKKKVKAQEKIEGKFFKENLSELGKILGLGEELKPEDYFQQGDCVLVQIGDSRFIDAPVEIKGEIQKSNVVLKGMINTHALFEGDYDIYRDENDQVYIDVKSFAILDHVKDEKRFKGEDNHHAQYIPKGKYFLRGVMEFDHLEKMARQVID